MKAIGITGGVGAGKSSILAYLEERLACPALRADEIARAMQEPGGVCYEPMVALLGPSALNPDGSLNRELLSRRLFSEPLLRTRVNAIIHPAVKGYLLAQIGRERKLGAHRWLFIEAALLIEDGYGKILDEIWYVYADRQTRLERLCASRGYSPEKARRIMDSQLSEGAYRTAAKEMIDNSGSLESAKGQVDKILRRNGWKP